MTKKTDTSKWDAQANFVFKGVVRKLKASTFEHLPAPDGAAAVKVEEIVKAPEILEQYAGSEITVLAGDQEEIRAGERAIFYTQSVMVGASLVVQSLGHLPVTAAAGAGAAEPDPALREQVARADMVVTGRVASVRTIDQSSTRKARGGGGESFSPISEHNPIWQEAVIEVADVEKGSGAPKQIVVRFPASTDVLWSQAPKFEPGQEGVFLLSREGAEPAGVKRGRGAKPLAQKEAAKPHYTALDPAAIQPIQKVEAIRSMIRSRK